MGSMLTFALAMLCSAPGSEAPVWQQDYTSALRVGTETGKPIAVIMGNNAQGWNKIAKEGTVDPETAKILSDKYVCLYLDLSEPVQKQVAESFQVSASPALIISSHGGKFQAFRHQGELAQSELKNDLVKFSDPNRPVTATEGNSAVRTSAYPPYDQPAGVGYAPVYYQPQWTTFPGSSSCPTCNRGR